MITFNLKSLSLSTIVAGTALLVSSCGNTNTGEGGTISIDGSSTVYPITEAIAEEYRAEARDKDVRVTVGVSGSGGGFKKFSRGEIDIANASRSINSDEAAMAEKNGISYLELPVAYDGLTVVVHPENDWVKDITVAELKKIWEPAAQGKITKWNQIRPEWPDKEIHLYGAGVESGTYDYFTEAIVGESHASRGDYTASEDDNVLVQGVSTDPLALGFFGYAYYDENKDVLKAIPVDDENDANGKGAIFPSVETVKDGTYAPLSRPLFIYVNSTAANKPYVVDFVDFYLKTAGDISREVGYIPMPEEKYKEQQEKFKSFVESTSTTPSAKNTVSTDSTQK